jgi:uncharacterized membrane protein YesL
MVDRRSARTAKPPSSGGESRLRSADLLRHAFKRSVWTTYDHIGLLVLANLLWLLLTLPVVTAPAAAAGLFHLCREINDGREPRLPIFFEGFRKWFTPALKLGIFELVVGSVLWVNTDFYSHLRGAAHVPGMILSAVMIWLTVFFVLMHAHLYPLLAGGETSLRKLVKKAALLTLDNFAFTVGITVQGLAMTVLCTVTGAGLVLINGSAVAMLLSTGHAELLRKYSDDPNLPTQALETRTFRDLWRPWESDTKE